MVLTILGWAAALLWWPLAEPFTSNLYIPQGQVFLLGEEHEGAGYAVSIDNVGRWPVLAQISDRSTQAVLTTARIERRDHLDLQIPADAVVSLENLGRRRAHLTVVLQDGFVEGMRYVEGK